MSNTVEDLFTEWLNDNGEDIIRDLFDMESMVGEKVDEFCDKEFDQIDVADSVKTAIDQHVQDAVEDAENRVKTLEISYKKSLEDIKKLNESVDYLLKEVSSLQPIVYGWSWRWWKFWK